MSVRAKATATTPIKHASIKTPPHWLQHVLEPTTLTVLPEPVCLHVPTEPTPSHQPNTASRLALAYTMPTPSAEYASLPALQTCSSGPIQVIIDAFSTAPLRSLPKTLLVALTQSAFQPARGCLPTKPPAPAKATAPYPTSLMPATTCACKTALLTLPTLSIEPVFPYVKNHTMETPKP